MWAYSGNTRLTPEKLVRNHLYEGDNPYAVEYPSDLMTAQDVEDASYEMITLLADTGDTVAQEYLEHHG